MYFSSIQANRLTEWIIKKYNDYPEFLWDKSPGCGIFRNKNNDYTFHKTLPLLIKIYHKIKNYKIKKCN